MSQRIIMIDTVALTGVYGGIANNGSTNPNGNPPDAEYAQKMWQWIETQLSQSDDFDYLLVAGHYQIVDAYGYYDIALRTHLLPLLKKYNAQAYLQGHRHTLEHVQGREYFVIDTNTSDLSKCAINLQVPTKFR